MRTIEQIKELRKATGMKQTVLAEKLGIEQSNYSNIENGKLITNKIQNIILEAEKILLPLLENKIFYTQTELDVLLSIQDQFKQ
jgi:transcriptional regulator with XRE-family HTH domain